MGAWDTGSFDNDDALDWVAELEAEGLPAAGGAIEAALEAEGEELDASEASMALAAAEVIAALRGQPALELPEAVRAWLARAPGDPGEELTANARRAVGAVLAGSELAQLWDESGEGAAWRAGVVDLQRRLR